MRILWICLAAAILSAVAILLFRRRSAPMSYVAVVAQGNALYEKGDTAGAARDYERAVSLAPESADTEQNLAIAYLRLNQNKEALAAAQRTLELDRNDPAAYYVIGCAHMHLLEWDAAIRAFQQSLAIDSHVASASFQLGLAQEQLGRLDDALHDFQAATLYDPGLAPAHFRLERLYQKLGRAPEAEAEMKLLQGLLSKVAPAQADSASLEACVYTRPRAPFILDEPARPGIPVRFVNATGEAFGADAAKYGGPVAAIDFADDGRNSLFVQEGSGAFRLLENRSGRFSPLGRAIPSGAGGGFREALVGDIDDDGFQDVIVLGVNGSRAIRFQRGGKASDISSSSGLTDLRAKSGLLADLDFTGNLDVVAVRSDGQGIQIYRNLGAFAFVDATEELGFSLPLPGALAVDAEDWGNDGLPTLFVSKKGSAPAFFSEHRASGFSRGTVSDPWPAASVVAGGDLNNDLETDAVIAGETEIDVMLSGRKEPVRLPLRGFKVEGLLLSDFDNDGWLDVFAYGPGGIRVWRNEGHSGFEDVTEAIGLAATGPVTGLVAADFSGRGAEDLVAVTPSGLEFLRNDGANANHLLRLHLKGTRSNASAIGARIELSAGGWRTSRTVRTLPIEIGTGSHAAIDTALVHWTDVTTTNVGVAAGPERFSVVEPKLPTGSCPYLYAWDGDRFRFVSDVLGAAPLGLPVSETRFVPSNPRELLALGDESQFAPRSGSYELRLTDELREILYLDQARLIAVDHPKGTLVIPTSKLVEGPPFSEPELWTLRPLRPPLRAIRSDGLDVTQELARIDGQVAGPAIVRRPQMRGYAEPYAIAMDFGEMDVHQPLVLALTGWLQFGGGMANIAASLDREAGPPFPTLEAQLADGTWRRIETDVGAPCGKTKTILVDLRGRLPEGTRQLRLTTSFEIYWDAALLCERLPGQGTARVVEPARADLRWRGFSRYEPEQPGRPLTPDYRRVAGVPPWDFTPAGWCTRYGDVRELIGAEDDRLAILNGGDELALSFPAGQLAPAAAGDVRDFFLFLSGWDKDADFHVRDGADVGPLPFHGMDDQAYGAQPRPNGLDGRWTAEFDTRWVGPAVLKRQPAPSP